MQTAGGFIILRPLNRLNSAAEWLLINRQSGLSRRELFRPVSVSVPLSLAAPDPTTPKPFDPAPNHNPPSCV